MKDSGLDVEIQLNNIDEARTLLRACSRRAPTGVRNAALLAVLYRGGLRVSEALALEAKDVDRKHGTVRILHGKGDRARTVGLDAGAFALVERWLEKRKALGIKRSAPLFCTLDGRPVDASYVRHLADLGRGCRRLLSCGGRTGGHCKGHHDQPC